jgi:hypothetical protein
LQCTCGVALRECIQWKIFPGLILCSVTLIMKVIRVTKPPDISHRSQQYPGHKLIIRIDRYVQVPFIYLFFIWTSSSSGFWRDIPKSARMPNWTLVTNMIQLCLLCSLFGLQGPHTVDKLCLHARPCLHNHYFLSGKNYEVIKCYLLTAKKIGGKHPKHLNCSKKLWELQINSVNQTMWGKQIKSACMEVTKI